MIVNNTQLKRGVFIQEFHPPSLPWRYTKVCLLMASTNSSITASGQVVMFADSGWKPGTQELIRTPSLSLPIAKSGTWLQIPLDSWDFSEHYQWIMIYNA